MATVDNSPQGLLLQSMGGPGGEYLTGLNSTTGSYFGDFSIVQLSGKAILYKYNV